MQHAYQSSLIQPIVQIILRYLVYKISFLERFFHHKYKVLRIRLSVYICPPNVMFHFIAQIF